MKNRSGRYKWLFHFSILMTAWSMALMNSSTVFAWGDSGGGRQSHTVDEINKNVLGEAIIFNTISNGEQVGGYGGDEKNFVSAKKSSEDPKGIITIQMDMTQWPRILMPVFPFHKNQKKKLKLTALLSLIMLSLMNIGIGLNLSVIGENSI